MSRAGTERFSGQFEKDKDVLPVKDPAPRVAIFVMENLPAISILREMAENGSIRRSIIGDKEWTLKVISDKLIASSERTNNVKHVILTNETEGEEPKQFGIFADEKLRLALGVLNGNESLLFVQPIKLAKTLRELREINQRRIRKSLMITDNPRETAARLGLRLDYVLRVAHYLHKTPIH